MMMSLGLYSNVWLRRIIIGIQVVKGGVPSFHQNLSRYISSFTSIGTTVIELREFKKKKKNNMDKMGKLLLAIIFTFGVF